MDFFAACPRQIKYCHFNLDGIICFIDKFHYQAWKSLADRLGMTADKRSLRRRTVSGSFYTGSAVRLIRGRSQVDGDPLLQRFPSNYRPEPIRVAEFMHIHRVTRTPLMTPPM